MLALLIVLIVIGVMILTSIIFLFFSNRKKMGDFPQAETSNGQDLDKISQTLDKLPILDTKIESLAQTINSQSSFLPKMETKIDALEQKAATGVSIDLLRENLAQLQKLTNDLDKKAKTIEVKTDGYAEVEKQKLSQVNTNLGEIKSIDEKISNHLEVAMGQTQMIPTIDTKVDVIKQRTNDINAIRDNLNKLNNLVENLNQATTTLSADSKNSSEQNLLHLQAVQKEINDLNKIFINDRNRGHSGEKILEEFLGNYFGAKGKTRLWETQYKVTNINKKDQDIGLVDAVIFTPYEDQKIAIDAKFPTLDYQKIFDENGKENLIYKKEFENKIKNKVKDLKKYIHPDNQIASVIMFLPSENIYYFIANKCAEILDYAYGEKIWLAGPTILMSILNSQSQVVRDFYFSKNINHLKDTILSLRSEFKRFDERATDLKNTYDRFVKSADTKFKEMRTTQDKINSKVERLESLEDEQPNDKNFLELNPQSRVMSEI